MAFCYVWLKRLPYLPIISPTRCYECFGSQIPYFVESVMKQSFPLLFKIRLLMYLRSSGCGFLITERIISCWARSKKAIVFLIIKVRVIPPARIMGN